MSVSPVGLCSSSAQPRPPEVTGKWWEQTLAKEEEGLAGRQQDIPSCWDCCCTHFLQLFPAARSSQRSAEVEQAPPSAIILPSPATLPLLTAELSPLSPHPLRLAPASALYDLSRWAFYFFSDSAFMIFPSFSSPSVPCSHSFISFLFVALLTTLHCSQFPSVIFSHRFRDIRGPTPWDFLLKLQLISTLLQRYTHCCLHRQTADWGYFFQWRTSVKALARE